MVTQDFADMALLKPKQREAVFRAIADPTRREILGLLRRRKHTVNELAGNFRTSRPAISKHLRLLRRVRRSRWPDKHFLSPHGLEFGASGRRDARQDA